MKKYITIFGNSAATVHDSEENLIKVMKHATHDVTYIEVEIDLSKLKTLPRQNAIKRPRKIETSNPCPPIPTRDLDWQAVYEDYDGAPDSHCPIGHGATELEAINDLISQEEP